MNNPVPLWRQMRASSTAWPDVPGLQHAAMLDVVAGYLCVNGHEAAAFLLQDESAKALEGK